MIISVAILFIISFFVVKINKHELFHPALAVTFQLMPALVAGSILGKYYGRSLLILGIIEGSFIAVLYLLVSFCTQLGNADFTAFLTSIPYIISSAVLGSITSGSKKKKI